MTKINKLIPGLILTMGISGICIYLAQLPALQKIGISSAILAIVGGMLLGNFIYRPLAPMCTPGVDFTKQRILRLAIILFGLKLTIQDIAQIGVVGILVDIAIICSTFFLAMFLGTKLLKLDKQTTILIGSGCSICGAAAILATSPVITSSSDKTTDIVSKVSVSVATVVIFGTIAMFVYPLIYMALPQSWGISDSAFGIYIGSTIHEVAQVAGAGYAINENVANGAVITKMIRVLMLAPFLLILSVWQAKRVTADHENASSGKSKIIIPWFAVGFIIMAGISSTGLIPLALKSGLIWLDNLLLTAAMAALGLTTHYTVFQKAGLKPMLLALLLFFWLMLGGALINAALQWVTMYQ